MDIDVHLADKHGKRKYVRAIFDVVAPGYDTFTRLFSFGMDKGWKCLLVNEGAKRAAKDALILDLACGTGDLGTELSRSVDARLAVGFDLSPRMLTEAKVRLGKEGGKFLLAACDILDLCLADRTVDVVSIGYGLRNTADVVLAVKQIARVLKPGGILLNLDFYRPVSAVWRELFLWYMWNAGRLAGWLWHREPIT